MRFISTAWITQSFDHFERQSCLRSHAKLGLASSSNPFEIFMLAGFEKIPELFHAEMKENHIHFFDLSAKAVELNAKFSRLKTACNVNDYEFFCFIRWLVLKDTIAPSSFIHIDLDLFFTQSFAEMEPLFEGRTGTFGSPCLTCISDYNWLHVYEQALTELAHDRELLQKRFKYDGNAFRKDFSSDQDLISEMERLGELPYQALDFLQSDYCAFINPLWPYQGRGKTLEYSLEDGKDCFNKTNVLFWHLQNNFAEYLSRFACLQSYAHDWPGKYLPVRLGLPFLQLNPTAENFAFYALKSCAGLIVADPNLSVSEGPWQCFQRSWISDWFVVQKNGRDLFSKSYWWEDGVFQA